MVWRILLILTRVSTRVPVIYVGAFLAVYWLVPEPAAFCGAALVGGAGVAALGASVGLGGAGVEACDYRSKHE